MLLIVALFELPAGTLAYLSDRSSDLFEDIILVPAQFPPLMLLAGCFFAMPIARRLCGEQRSMGIAETLAVGLTTVVLFLSLASVSAGGASGSATSRPSPAATPAARAPAASTAGGAAPLASPPPGPGPRARGGGEVAPSRHQSRLSASQVAGLAGANLASLLATAYVFPGVYRLIWLRGRRSRGPAETPARGRRR